MRLIHWKDFDAYHACINGVQISFETAEQKFLALEKACVFTEGPTKTITRPSDIAIFAQIVGMGMLAVPFLVKRLAVGQIVWASALLFISVFPTDVPLSELMDLKSGPLNHHLWVKWAKELVNAHSEAEVKETCQDIHEAWRDIAKCASEISECKGS